jgi:WD40 repeat protein
MALSMLSATCLMAAVPTAYTNAGVSPNGDFVAIADGAMISILRASDLSLVQQISVPGGAARSASWSSDRRYLAAAGDGGYGNCMGQVTVWRTDTWQPVAYLPTQGYAYRPAFIPGATRLVEGAGDSSLVLWDFGKRRIVRRFRDFSARPQCIVVAPDRSFIAVGAYPTGYVYGVDGKILRRLPDCLGAIAVSSDSRRILYAVCTGDHPPLVEVDVRTGRRVQRPTKEYAPQLFFYRPDDHSFVGLGMDYYYGPDGEKKVASELVRLAREAKRGPDVKRPVSGFLPPLLKWPAGPSIKLMAWQPVPHPPVDAPRVDTPGVKVTRWKSTDDGPEDITAVESTTVTDLYVKSEAGKETGYRLPGHVYSPTISPNRRYIAYVTNVRVDTGDTCPIRVLDLQTGRLSPVPFTTTYDSRVSWSSDSRYLAVFNGGFDFSKYSTQRVLYCWSLKSNTMRCVATGWTVDVSWTNAGLMDIESGDDRHARDEFCYTPATNMLSLASNGKR